MLKSHRKKTMDLNEIAGDVILDSINIPHNVSPRKKVKNIEELLITSKNANTSDTTSNISPTYDIEINISSFEYLKRKRKKVKFQIYI